jgi:hypothetical protein
MVDRWRYTQRLQREGFTLAGCGLAGCVLLVSLSEGATDNAVSTAMQLVIVLVLMTGLGLLSVRRAVAGAEPVGAEHAGDGEPTPLWQLPLIVAGLTAVGSVALGLDAGLRVAGGCAVIGLVQALVLRTAVAGEERRTGRSYVRTAGSRIVRGSRLAYVD